MWRSRLRRVLRFVSGKAILLGWVVLGIIIAYVLHAGWYLLSSGCGILLPDFERYRSTGNSQVSWESCSALTRNFVLMLATPVALFGLWLAHQRLRLERKKSDDESYRAAVDMLGNQKISVRQGGIYALQQFAMRGGQSEDYVVQVLKSLAAFIRDRSAEVRKEQPEIFGELGRERDRNAIYQGGLVFMPGDIEDALWAYSDVLREAIERRGLQVDKAALNLSGAYLYGLDGKLRGGLFLPSVSLRKMILVGWNLSGANLSHTLLNDSIILLAQLTDTNLSNSWMIGVDMQSWMFDRFDQTDFTGARVWLDPVVPYDTYKEGMKLNKTVFPIDQICDLHDAGWPVTDASKMLFTSLNARGLNEQSLAEQPEVPLLSAEEVQVELADC